jgi:signal transduction histidine kinase/ligand-binding sensor domain-containing protein/DNA-binding response OmpR family regulator
MKKLKLLVSIIFIFFCFFFFLLQVNAQQDRFYTPYHGLSNTSFNAVFQDKDGFLWFATQNGLNKFDGHNFAVYQHNPLDTNSLDNSAVLSVFQDSKGVLWVGTEYGLHIYNQKTDNFSRIPLLFNNAPAFIQITAILEDKNDNLWLITSLGLVKFGVHTHTTTFFNKDQIQNVNVDRYLMNAAIFDEKGGLWIASDKNGLFYFDPRTNKFTNYRYDQGLNSVCDNSILSLGKDSVGNIIIGTVKGGISIYNTKKQSFTTIYPSNKPGNIFNGGVYSIINDKKGTVWVGTERNGLKILNCKTNTLIDANSGIHINNVEDTKIHCFPDREGNLWLTIDYAGIYIKKGKTKPFFNLAKNIKNGRNISYNIVKSILYDKLGNLWVGTDGGGLNCLPENSSIVKKYTYNPETKGSLPDNAVISLFEDEKQNLWVGTYLGGLALYNRKTGNFSTYLIDPLRKGRDFNFVTSIISDKANNLWISTNGGGLQHFNTKTKVFTRIQSVTINNNNIELPAFLTTLLLDDENTLWIGSYNGLFCWNANRNTYESFTTGNGRLVSEGINTIHEEKKAIWFGTAGGLQSIDKKTHEITRYSLIDGLPNNSVFGIVNDNKGNLWFSTLNGLSKFNPHTKIFRNYYTYDGLPGNEFRPASCFKASNGFLYFGSTLGVVYFNPDSIHEISTFPTLVLTKFKIYNTTVPIGKTSDNRIILSQSINETKHITLNFSDKNFTVEFAAIEYNAPEKIKYGYMLEGFDQKWNYSDYNQRYATYSNLSPGNYTFKVKTTNSDGLWNEQGKTIIIQINPPFWRMWWAYFIYVCIALAIFITTRKLVLFRIAMRNKLEIEQMEREKLEELNQSKMQFFSNVSHEFRTPLTLILGPVERLLYSKADGAVKKQLEFVHRNALRMLRLVNLLLDLQKVEKNEMRLNAQLGDIVGFTKEIAYTFTELAHNKKISLTFTSGIEKLDAWFDSDKLDKVLFNILSNAVKFTSKGGAINVTLSVNKNETNQFPLKEYILISVSDTGKGMKEEHLTRIFERFYQVERHDSDEIQLGTGIGLHLSKYLVELHKGEINVTSKVGEGTRFDILLPLGSEHLDASQKYTDTTEPLIEKIAALADLEPEEDSLIENTPVSNVDKKATRQYRILIVEDDYDVRTYIKSELSEFYDIIEAHDGMEGWTMAKEKMPELIISDVMMPKMDGIQLCKKIKTDLNTSHIPVILLTARTSIENRIEGLETGADSYIPKPFHPQHLKIRIEKLIELRQSLINKFSKSVSFEAREMTLTSADERFMDKAINLVKENISNPDLNIEEMSTELGMSRVHLYRKLKALTNQTPSEFVRTIRLKQSAYLLSQHKLNISEVAYAVGFSSHQYFTNCFQNYFNMSPTEYSMKEKN